MAENRKNTPVKTRYCPSPTGLMHLGNVRTALFNALFAKNQSGTFLLRIEDTDQERSDSRYTEIIQKDLHWLGLAWDEGPYYQSQRQTIYNDCYQRLQDTGLAYPCFCSEEQLALTRKIQRSSGKPPRYPGTCRSLSSKEIAEKMAEDIKPTLRFRVPEEERIEFDDLVHGRQTFYSGDIGDFIIRRADGTPPFMFCNAVDDALMGVTHALRGEDHLTNTPRQIMLLQALKLPVPTYAHIALIIGPDGSPLSKRHGSRSVEELRQAGYLPEAIVNYLARLGHYYGHDEFLSVAELAAEFKIEALNKSPAKFNPEQLQYWQKAAVMHLNTAAIWEWLGAEVRLSVPEHLREEFLQMIKPNVCYPSDVRYWIKIVFGNDLTMNEKNAAILKNAGADYFRVAVSALQQHGTNLEAITQHLREVLNLSGKSLYLPLRVAITGKIHGPELAQIIKLMKKSEVRRRLEMAI